MTSPEHVHSGEPAVGRVTLTVDLYDGRFVYAAQLVHKDKSFTTQTEIRSEAAGHVHAHKRQKSKENDFVSGLPIVSK